MPITFRCECGELLSMDDEHAGMQSQCPHCGQILTVPERSTRTLCFGIKIPGGEAMVPGIRYHARGKREIYKLTLIDVPEPEDYEQRVDVTCPMTGQTVSVKMFSDEQHNLRKLIRNIVWATAAVFILLGLGLLISYVTTDKKADPGASSSSIVAPKPGSGSRPAPVSRTDGAMSMVWDIVTFVVPLFIGIVLCIGGAGISAEANCHSEQNTHRVFSMKVYERARPFEI